MNPLALFQQKSGSGSDGLFGPNTLRKGIEYLQLTDVQGVHFFAQCGHESGGFKIFEENLKYSKENLLRVFGKYFDEATAEEYQYKPEAIANIVYANRNGNGDTASGEGWKFRGRGAIQLTGKSNYQAFSDFQGIDFVANPDAVETEYAFESAIFFFRKNDLFSFLTDYSEEIIKRLTKRVNGGYNGLDHRIELTNKYKGYLS